MLDNDVHYFLKLAETGSMGRAAEALGLSQPALSKSLVRLETRVGTSLMMRTPKGMVLTEAGQAFLRMSSTAAAVLDDAVQAARDLGAGHAGHVHIGITPATSNFLLNALFPKLLEERPAAVIKLTTAFNDQLFEHLLNRDMAMAVCPLPDTLPAGLTQEVLYDDSFYLVFNESHPLASKHGSFDPQDLHKYQAAASGPQEIARQNMEKLIRSFGLRPPTVVVEANTLEALVSVVSKSPLLTIFPRSAYRPEALPSNLVLLPLDMPGLTRRIGLIFGPGYRSSLAERAAQITKEAAQAQVAASN